MSRTFSFPVSMMAALSAGAFLMAQAPPLLGQGTIIQEAKLTAADHMVADNFGGSVALSGDTALIAVDHAALFRAHGNDMNRGAAYVLSRGATTYTKLEASDGTINTRFGGGVALNGDTALIGAARGDDGGSAYVFPLRAAGSLTSVMLQLEPRQ